MKLASLSTLCAIAVLTVGVAHAQAPAHPGASSAVEVIGADSLPGNRDAVQLPPGEVFAPSTGGGPPPWDSGPLARGPTLVAALEAAQSAIDACASTAHADVGVGVVDTVGQPRATLAANGVRGWHIYSAIHKALTAVAFREPTSKVAADVAASAAAAARLKRNMTTLPGAVPLMIRGEVVGAIGVSGAKSGEQDERCAEAGAAKFNSNPR